MANRKISELPDADLPLSGNEHLALVQGGASKRVALSRTSPVIIQMSCSDLSTNLDSHPHPENAAYVRAPVAFRLTEVRASVLQPSNDGDIEIDITDGEDSILSGLLVIPQFQVTSLASATQPLIETVDIPDDALIQVRIVTPGSGAQGLIVTLKGMPQ